MEVLGDMLPLEEHYESDDEDLSEKQIEQLLKQAETRLLQQHSRKHDSRYVPAIPAQGKLDISNLPAPYVQTEGQVARPDSQRLLDEKHRKLANSGIRKVEDPVILKRKNLEVRQTAQQGHPHHAYEENFPKLFFLDAESRVPSWCPSALSESFFIHSYSEAFLQQALHT